MKGKERASYLYVCPKSHICSLRLHMECIIYWCKERNSYNGLPEKFTTNVQIEVLMKVLSLKDSLQWWLKFLMTLCYKDSMNCQFIILEVRVLTPIDNILFPSNDIMSRHKERSINRPFKRYATSFFLAFSLILCVMSWGFIKRWIGIWLF